jgi:hypothetical protein
VVLKRDRLDYPLCGGRTPWVLFIEAEPLVRWSQLSAIARRRVKEYRPQIEGQNSTFSSAKKWIPRFAPLHCRALLRKKAANLAMIDDGFRVSEEFKS